jgi:hypothetical protein
MRKSGDTVFYINSQDEIREGIFKGIITGYCKFTQTLHVNDKETGENLLIDTDYVFTTLNEAKIFLE